MTSAPALELSETIASIVASSSPGVVRVEGGRRGPATGIVWAEGVVVTVDHALDREGDVTLGHPDGSTSPAAIVGRDPATDVAVLRTAGRAMTPLVFAGTEGAKVGHLAVALARPGRSVRASLGVIGALGDGWTTYAGGRVDQYVQMDRGPLPGFSGGPLLDLPGRALGLLTAGLVRGATIAIPAATLRRVAGEILATGGAERGYLGVSCQAVPLPDDLSKRVGQESGLLVFQVQGGSPAAEAGLMLGDVLVALDGSPLTRLSGLLAALSAGRAAGRSTLRLLRAGRVDEIPVAIGARSW
jgi:S1-C subfamily serine protease